MREKKGDSQMDLFTQDNYSYRTILTNDHQSTEKEAIEYLVCLSFGGWIAIVTK